MERQDVDPIDVAEIARESGDLRDVLEVVRQSRHQRYLPEPDASPARCEAASEVQRRAHVHANEVAITMLRIPGLRC